MAITGAQAQRFVQSSPALLFAAFCVASCASTPPIAVEKAVREAPPCEGNRKPVPCSKVGPKPKPKQISKARREEAAGFSAKDWNLRSSVVEDAAPLTSNDARVEPERSAAGPPTEPDAEALEKDAPPNTPAGR